MWINFKLNKGKTFSFRINPQQTRTELVLKLPGVTITLSIRRKSMDKNLGSSGKDGSDMFYPSRTVKKIQSAPMDFYKPEEYQLLLKEISRLLFWNRISTWLILFIITALLGIILKIYLHTLGRISFVNNQEAKDKEKLSAYNQFIDICKMNMNAEHIWQIPGIIQVSDKKKNGGLEIAYDRTTVELDLSKPFFMKTNETIITIKTPSNRIYLFPDMILITQKSKAGIIKASDITLDIEEVSYVENTSIPKDATITEYTWKYVNNDGTPDKRYKNNMQLPICSYGSLHLQSESGLNLLLHCSDVSFIEGLVQS